MHYIHTMGVTEQKPLKQVFQTIVVEFNLWMQNKKAGIVHGNGGGVRLAPSGTERVRSAFNYHDLLS